MKRLIRGFGYPVLTDDGFMYEVKNTHGFTVASFVQVIDAVMFCAMLTQLTVVAIVIDREGEIVYRND